MQKIISIQMISVIFFSLFQSFPRTQISTSQIANLGVDITYEVTITAPPDAGIKVKAAYSGITSPLKLQIGYENWPDPTIDILKDLQLSSLDGKPLSWSSINNKTIEVVVNDDAMIANYTIDLAKTGQRGTKVSTIGGVLSGYEVFPLPIGQQINNIKVKFLLPQPWKVISFFPVEGDWFEVEPITYADLLLEAKAADWYFGNVDFDQTKNYQDGFKIRVVGFKNFPYEHWDVYMGDTPLDEAFKSADFYHKTYLKLKEIFGEYPYNNILLVGPGYWQTRSTYMRQQMVGWYRYEYIPHHMIHTYFGMQGSRLVFSGRSYQLLGEGYTTYSEGIMSATIAEEPYWRGMMYERKFHYLRGMKFNNLNESSHQDYVLGFIVTYLMDQKIRSDTNGQKGIDDLMAMLWQKFNTPNFAGISDEQFLETLKDLTGQDWYGFYYQNMINTNHLDVDQLDNLKGDFDSFLKVISDTWYNGYPSMYFVSQEIVAAAGDFDMEVRLQSRDLTKFSLTALQQMDKTQTDLTEADVEEVLRQITGKDHSDFFEFYRNQGFEIDLNEVNNFVRTYTFKMWGMDNAVKLSPNTFPLGKSTLVMGEMVDSDFASAKEILLQVQVYKKPTGLADLGDFISGSGVSYQGSHDYPDCGDGSACTNHYFSLPKIMVGEKTYTVFTINMPKGNAGVMKFSFYAKNADPTTEDHLGGFDGTQKVTFQNDSTFIFKPESYDQLISYGDLSLEEIQNLLKNISSTGANNSSDSSTPSTPHDSSTSSTGPGHSGEANYINLANFGKMTIKMDGYSIGWPSVSPLATDPQESGPYDFKSLYGSSDENYLYLRIDPYNQFSFNIPARITVNIVAQGENQSVWQVYTKPSDLVDLYLVPYVSNLPQFDLQNVYRGIGTYQVIELAIPLEPLGNPHKVTIHAYVDDGSDSPQVFDSFDPMECTIEKDTATVTCTSLTDTQSDASSILASMQPNTQQDQPVESSSSTIRWIVIIFGSLLVIALALFFFKKVKH